MSPKLWQAGAAKLDPVVEGFLASDDLQWDQLLLPYDLLGSAAQARVLVRAGVLSRREGQRLVSALATLCRTWERGGLGLRLSDEDAHTRIEAELTKRLGPVGKKIHTGRSRNDQVLTALHLYRRDALLDLREGALALAAACLARARAQASIPMPGYTHLQRAMPSSVGLWMGAWAEAFLLDADLLAEAEGSWPCPLGSGSGFGTLVNPDRAYAASLLGMQAPGNVLAAQTRRGKPELAVLHAVAQALLDCNRLASDGLLFSTAEFGFVRLPASLTTGSSLMPNKRNADVWELVRASYALHLGDLTALASVQAGLPSGYNRDLQVTKGLLMGATERAREVLEVLRRTVAALQIDAKRCREACDEAVLATDRATLLALSGTPFRDAYRAVKGGAAGKAVSLEGALRGKRAVGAPGNLGLDRLASGLKARVAALRKARTAEEVRARNLLTASWRMGR